MVIGLKQFTITEQNVLLNEIEYLSIKCLDIKKAFFEGCVVYIRKIISPSNCA